jgi:hypothetical protein
MCSTCEARVVGYVELSQRSATAECDWDGAAEIISGKTEETS